MNALEDIVETYYRRVKKCPFVDRNIFLDEGEVDLIAVSFSPTTTVMIVEAAAGKNLYGPGNSTNDKVRAKFERAQNYVKNVDHLKDAILEFEFWAPHITPQRKQKLEEKGHDFTIKIVDKNEVIRRLSEIQDITKNVDLKTLDSVSQLLQILPNLKGFNVTK